MLCLAHLGQIHQVFLPAMRPKLRAMPDDQQTHIHPIDAVRFCNEQKKDKTHSNIAIMFHHAFCNVALHLDRAVQKRCYRRVKGDRTRIKRSCMRVSS